MAILAVAIETSGRIGSVAVLRDGVVVAADEFAHGLKHAAGLVPMIDALLVKAGVEKESVGEVYVSVGPGSFTGLRIAVTVVKVWAMVGGVKVVAVPSVRAIVENLGREVRHAAVVLDAKRGQVFTASYSRGSNGEWAERFGARLRTLSEVVAGEPRPVVVTGEGLDYHALSVEEGVTAAGRELWGARADVVGRLGYAMARAGEFAEVMTLTPTYVRLAEAEEKWRLERGEAL